MKRITWYIAAGLAVAAAAALYARSGGGPRVKVAPAKRGVIQEYVEEQAKTRLPETYLVTMPFDGRVEPINLIEGQRVSQGETVARVKAFDTELAVREAQAAVDRLQASIRRNDDVSVERTVLTQSEQWVESMEESVKAAAEQVRAGQEKFEYARAHERRYRQLYESKTITEEELDRARLELVTADVELQQNKLIHSAMKAMQVATRLLPTTVQQYMDRKALDRDVLEQELAEAKVRLARAEENQQRGVMKSPASGVILERAESNERFVPAGTVLLRIGQIEELEIEAEILSQDVVAVKEDDSVEIFGPAIGPEPVAGVVKRVYPTGFTKISSLGVEQQRVKVIVGFAPGVLAKVQRTRPLGVDYRVNVRIFTDASSDAIVVPRASLFRGVEGQWQVFAVRDGVARLVTVEVGLMNDHSVEITRGLSAGDPVIIAPDSDLRDRMRVEIAAD